MHRINTARAGSSEQFLEYYLCLLWAPLFVVIPVGGFGVECAVCWIGLSAFIIRACALYFLNVFSLFS